MLILNLKIAKHSQHIPVRAYHLNADANDSQWCCQSLENWKLQINFSVITKNNCKNKNSDNIHAGVFWFYESNS